MGRIVIAEEYLESHINTFFHKDKWFIGVILGQITEQRDYVLHLATTPKPESREDEEDSQSATKMENLDKVEDSWISTHARQVVRMLPGGLNVLGIFAVAPPDVMKTAQAKLRQVLFAVHKVVDEIESPVLKDRILLQICPLTKKLTCRTFDVSDPKSSARPADWKYQRFSDKLHRLETRLAVHCTIPVHNKAMSHSLERQILTGIQPYCDNIRNSIATIDHQMAGGDNALVPVEVGSGKKGRKHQEDVTGRTFNVNFYEIMPAVAKDAVSSPVLSTCGAKLSVRGTMTCRAFVHSKASRSEAVQALKVDAVRSLTSRCQLLCEDFLQTEEEQDRKVLYETPLRVFAPLGDTNIQLCDYMFPDETNNDVVDRFKELLSTTIPEDTLETDCEKLPDNAELEDTEVDVQESDIHQHQNFTSPERQGFTVMVYILGAMVVFLAVLIGYLFQKDYET